MKTHNEFKIKHGKILKNEELLILKGGSVPGDCHCMCYTGDPIPQPVGLIAATCMADCIDNCHTIEPSYGHTWNCLY